ncbi:MAG TPA: glycerol kinase, partial [Clostridiales bacterium]|nr:glycerol kinase [Clostridiales bacterium]
EITALGAAYLAGLSAGVWKSQHEIVEQRKKDYVTLPNMTSDHREKLLQGWRKAVSRSFDWEERS